MNVVCELSDAPTADDQESVNSILRDHNRHSTPLHWSALDNGANKAMPVNVLARSESGQVVGGLFGETQFAWLKVNVLAVRKEHRRYGVGTRIMSFAETEAVQRGCKYSFLDTMDFQAPEFYLRCGYEIVGSIPDWDSHGHTKYFLTKTLKQR